MSAGVRVAFVLWAKQELQYFVSVFSGQVFVTKYNLSAVAECVTEATCYCSQVLTSISVHLQIQYNIRLFKSSQTAI